MSHLSINVKAIIFDFDGTIIDTMFDYARELAKLINRRVGMNYRNVYNQYLRTSGIPSSYQIKQILHNYPENVIHEIDQEFLKIKRRILMEKDVRPEFKRIVNILGYRGIMSFISSNLEQELLDDFISTKRLKVTEALGYRGRYFMKGKPHIIYIANKYNLPLNNMVFIADSLRDLEYAEECGIHFIGIEGIFKPSDFKKLRPDVTVISDLSQIIKILNINVDSL